MTDHLRSGIERAHEERRSRDLILSSMGEAVLLVGSHGAIEYRNPAAERLLQSVPAQATDLPSTLRRLLARARDEAGPREEEASLDRRVLVASAVPVGIGDRVLLVLRNVTAARRADAVRREFVANASHELKTPAASIRAAAEMMTSAVEDDPGAAKRLAERLEQDAIRLGRLVADLLDLSRLEAERPAFAPVRLDRLVEGEVDRRRRDAADAGLALEVRTIPAVVRGSTRDLGLLVGNLLENATGFTPRGGRIEVRLSQADGLVVLTIEDTGIGIPTRHLDRIFERFYRVERARSRETGGTGLGLSIAKHVAELHGGRIEAESELGRGSTFRVVLPVTGTQRS